MSTDLVKKIDKYAPKLRAFAFFAAVFLYSLLVIEPRLIYFAWGLIPKYSNFIIDANFISQFLNYPGGICVGLSKFLLQFYHTNIFGALIATLIAYMLYTSARKISLLSGAKLSDIFFFIPALIVIVTHGSYERLPTADLWLPITLYFFVAFEKRAPSNTLLRCTIFAFIFTVQYYIVGGTGLMFAILAATFALTVRKNVLESLFYILIAIIVPYIMTFFFFDTIIKTAYINNTMFDADIATSKNVRLIYPALYIYIIAIPIIAAASKKYATLPAKKQTHQKDLKKTLGSCLFKNAVLTTLLLAAFAATANNTLDRTSRKMYHIGYLANQHRWSELLEYTSDISDEQYNLFVNYHVNRALYHTGQLAENMFSYRQSPESLLLNSRQLSGYSRDFVGGQVCMELGHLNLAEQKTIEAMTLSDNNPVILKRLALINLAKGQSETARTYLNALSKNLAYRGQARELLKRLENNPTLSGDEEIEYLRSVMLLQDSIVTNIGTEPILLNLLENNKNNKMAFEYLMAYYMLNAKLDKLVDNIYRLDDFGYQHIPRHYEEAILLYQSITGKKVDLKEWQIRRETLMRTEWFISIYNKYADKKYAANIMVNEFGSIYHFYYFFGNNKN
jgi:hypothetical protein